MSNGRMFDFPSGDLVNMEADQAIHMLLAHAADTESSDLFIHSDREVTDLCVRRLGVVQRIAVLPGDKGRALINYLKVVAGMNLSESRRPMDGRWVTEVGDRRLDLRINTLATLFGEDVTLRLWDRAAGLRNIGELGMTEAGLSTLIAMLNNPSGLVLVTGPTGTGKTTTLYACLRYLSDGTRKISALEDPVEFALPGVRQSQVNYKLGLDFPELLRNVLRQAPDVIMLGEIRDEETAKTAVRAANSGHLVLATLHAPSAASAVQSMFALDTNPYFLSSSLLGVIAQRLVRTLCPECRVGYDISEAPETFAAVRELLKPGEGESIYGPIGCDKCHEIGYAGRTGLFEILPLTVGIRRLVAQACPTSDIEKAAIAAGMIEFHRRALVYVARGVTSTEEILRDLPPEYLGLGD